MKQTNSKTNIFEAPPWQAIAGLCIPSLISIMVMMLYNMADMYFVAWTDDLRQVAAVSLASPVFSILMAISTMIGNGGCTKIAQVMGARDREAVQRYTSTGFWASIVFGLIFALICFVFITPLLGFLGATEDTFVYTRSYLLIMAAGAPIVLLNHSLGGMLRGEGLVKVGLASSTISTFANIALDPLFILSFKMGVAGAAIATVLGNAIATCYILLYHARRRDLCLLEIRPAYAKDLRMLGAILALGLPNAISSILSGLAGTFSNRLLVDYGTTAIAAMAAASKSVLIVTMVLMGLCMGIQPLLAYCYGSRDWKKLKGIVLRLLLLTVSLGAGLTAVMWIARHSMVGLFLRDADAAKLSVRIVGFLLLMGPFNGLYYLATNFLQAAGNAPAASIASALRQGLLLIPLLYLMEHFFGLIGLALAHTVADAAAILITSTMAILYYRKVSKENMPC